MTTLYLDLETYCEVPIQVGTHAYAEQAEIMLFAWAIDDGPVRVWDRTTDAPVPAGLRDALGDPAVQICAHNSGFDRTVLRHAMPELDLPIERWRDTMVQALAHSLPGALGTLCEILGVPIDKAKDKAGRQLVMLFCKPRPKASKVGRATRHSHPVEWRRFVEYAALDIEAMREVRRRLPVWNYQDAELALWHLDQRINDRGMLIDIELVEAAIAAVEAAQNDLAARTVELTRGEVRAATQRDALLRHLLAAYGVDLPDLTKSTLERRLADPDLPRALRELLAIRLEASTTSTSKYKTLVKGVNSDRRLRGTLQFDGASRTGRWAGRLFQPQNLPRPSLKQSEIDAGIDALKAGCADLVAPSVMKLTSNTIRGCIVAPAGRKLVVADLANIEGRTVAWLAGEAWKLAAFRAYDAGTGPDLYKVAYARAFRVLIDSVTKEHRQIGKVMELMLGYEGGVGAFLTGAATYSIDLDAMAEAAWPSIPADVIAEAKDYLEWRRLKKLTTYSLSAKTFIVCESLKRLWRRAHPQIVSFWKDLEAAACAATLRPGLAVECRKLKLRRDGAWLRLRLPSGTHTLCYPGPQVDESGKLSYMGVSQYSRKWFRLKTYGGKLCIAAGTQVLTRRGWIPIQKVNAGDAVWDGESWVRTSGTVHKGSKIVIQAYDVWMTPEHLILTTEGWKHASQSAGYHRASGRLPDGFALPGHGRTAFGLGSALRLRARSHACGERISKAPPTGCHSVMWMQASRNHRREKHDARNVEASGVRGLASNDRSVLSALASGMAQLWRAWNYGVRAMGGILFSFLGGYGAYLPEGPHARPGGQRRELQSEKLPLGDAARAGAEQEGQRIRCLSQRTDPRNRFCRDGGGSLIDGLLPAEAGPVLRRDDRFAKRIAEVYDLLDCGPQNRFVVATPNGPLIVHNCENATQAVARDVLAYAMPAIEEEGYLPILSVHDELLTEVPDSDRFSAEELAALMTRNPSWAPDLPLAAAGFEAARYRKD